MLKVIIILIIKEEKKKKRKKKKKANRNIVRKGKRIIESTKRSRAEVQVCTWSSARYLLDFNAC
jgi:hypothetical protein